MGLFSNPYRQNRPINDLDWIIWGILFPPLGLMLLMWLMLKPFLFLPVEIGRATRAVQRGPGCLVVFLVLLGGFLAAVAVFGANEATPWRVGELVIAAGLFWLARLAARKKAAKEVAT